MKFEETLDKMLAEVGLVKVETSKGKIELFMASDNAHANPMGAMEICQLKVPASNGRNWSLHRVESWKGLPSLFYAIRHSIVWFDKECIRHGNGGFGNYFDYKVANPWVGKSLSEIMIHLDLDSATT